LEETPRLVFTKERCYRLSFKHEIQQAQPVFVLKVVRRKELIFFYG
jgi:hypothetical protein